MKLRRYEPKDGVLLAKLFYHTVHTVNAKDYSKAQLNVWATKNIDVFQWNREFLEHDTVVVEIEDNIVGFGDMDHNGYLDRLYVHRDYQRRGIATAIVKELEQQAKSENVCCFTTHASITAKPFFENLGYVVNRKNEVCLDGVKLINFRMAKKIIVV